MSAPPPHGPSGPHQGQPSSGQYPQGPHGPPGYQGQPQQPGGPPPGFAGPPGQQPPYGPYPPPGGQGGPPPGGGNRKRSLLVVGAAAALLLVLAVGTVVYLVSESRPYASLPDCADAFPEEVFEDVAEGGSVDVDGEYNTEGDYDSLYCSVMLDDGDRGVANVEVMLHDPESQAYEDDYDLIADELEAMEDQLPSGEVDEYTSSEDFTYEEYAWDAGSPGDLGFSAVHLEPEDEQQPDRAFTAWMDNNLSVFVGLSYPPDDDMEWEDGLETVMGLSDDVSSRISSVAERE